MNSVYGNIIWNCITWMRKIMVHFIDLIFAVFHAASIRFHLLVSFIFPHAFFTSTLSVLCTVLILIRFRLKFLEPFAADNFHFMHTHASQPASVAKCIRSFFKSFSKIKLEYLHGIITGSVHTIAHHPLTLQLISMNPQLDTGRQLRATVYQTI